MGGISKIFGLFQTTSGSTVKKLERAVSKGRLTTLEMQNLQGVENEALRESLSISLAKFSAKSGEKAQRTVGQIDDLTYKFSLCDDKAVREEAQKILTTATQNPNITRKELGKAINQAEHLLDCVNTANGHYSTLFTDMNPTGYVGKLERKTSELLVRVIENYAAAKSIWMWAEHTTQTRAKFGISTKRPQPKKVLEPMKKLMLFQDTQHATKITQNF